MPHINVVLEGDEIFRLFGQPPDLSNERFVNVLFIDADLSRAQVHGAHFHDVQFIRCTLAGVNFDQATFSGKGDPFPS